jgi:hypothetical protein
MKNVEPLMEPGNEQFRVEVTYGRYVSIRVRSALSSTVRATVAFERIVIVRTPVPTAAHVHKRKPGAQPFFFFNFFRFFFY